MKQLYYILQNKILIKYFCAMFILLIKITDSSMKKRDVI